MMSFSDSLFAPHRLSGLLLSALLGIAGTLTMMSANAAVYKWVDENGVTQYSSTPPPEHKAEKLRLAPSPSQAETDRAIQNLKQNLSNSRAQDAQDKAAADLSAKDAADKHAAFAERCQKAKQDLQTFQRVGRVYSLNDKGERVYVSDQARPARVQELQDFISANCQ